MAQFVVYVPSIETDFAKSFSTRQSDLYGASQRLGGEDIYNKRSG